LPAWASPRSQPPGSANAAESRLPRPRSRGLPRAGPTCVRRIRCLHGGLRSGLLGASRPPRSTRGAPDDHT
jgi:hypothetical protein